MLAFFVSWRTSLFVGLGALLLILVLFSVIYHNYWVIPHRHIASVTPGVLKQKEILELRNNIRQSFIQALGVLGGVIGGAVLLGGLYFTARTLRISLETLRVNQKTLETTQQRQITERFTKAIEQLGSDNRAIRLGGIYALERIARDSEYDHGAVMEVLTTFVREQAPAQRQPENTPQDGKEQQPLGKLLEEEGFDVFQEAVYARIQTHRLRADIQTILTVLGRRTRTYENGESQRLNLQFTNLRYADLQGAQLQGAMLDGAQLQGANLRGAKLQHASLSGADL
jgi:Pentapeptide repeats (8 copies)